MIYDLQNPQKRNPHSQDQAEGPAQLVQASSRFIHKNRAVLSKYPAYAAYLEIEMSECLRGCPGMP